MSNKYRALHGFVGVDFSFNEGEIVAMSDAEAQPLLSRGIIERAAETEPRSIVVRRAADTDAQPGPSRTAVRQPRSRRAADTDD